MMDHIDPEADAYEPGFEMKPKASLNAENETTLTFKRSLYAMLFGMVILALFHSASLVTYVRGLPIGPVEDTVIAVSEAWHEQMDKNGMTELFTLMDESVTVLHDATWDDFDAFVSGLKQGEPPEDLRGGVAE